MFNDVRGPGLLSEPTSLPFASFTSMIDTLFASRLTMTKRRSSEVRAIVVDRVGAAAARPTSPTNTAARTITYALHVGPFKSREGFWRR